MNKNEIILCKLLSAAIRKQPFTAQEIIKEIDWEELYNEAFSHQVHTIIFPLVEKIFKLYKLDNDIVTKWKKTTTITGMVLLQNYYRMGEVLKVFNDSGIQVIALKGVVLNEFYPQPEFRIMSDIDILVHEYNIKESVKIIEKLGYIPEKDKNTKHIKFSHQDFINIELHRSLIEYDCIKNKQNFEEIVWINPRQIEINNFPVLALSWELQVLHVCIHMAFHTIYEGFGLRQLCDLVLLVESKKTEIDWNIVIEKSKEYGIETFVYALFEVCNRLFQMEIPVELSNKLKGADLYLEKFISDIINSGNLGSKDRKRFSANLLLKNSSNDKNSLHTNRGAQILRFLFPSYKKLANRYKYIYIKKYPVLTPVAWIHRIIYGITRKDIDRNSKISLLNNEELLKIAEERDKLLHWFGLR